MQGNESFVRRSKADNFVGLVFARTAGPYMIVVSGILILTGVLMWVFERTNRKLLTDDGMAQFER